MKRIFAVLGLLIILSAVAYQLYITKLQVTKRLYENSQRAGITPTPSSNIFIISPKPNDKVSSVVSVKGSARVFENVVHLRLKDQSGKILVESTVYAQSPESGKFGDFEKNINFTKGNNSQITLEVFQSSPKDGTEVDKIIIPLSVN